MSDLLPGAQQRGGFADGPGDGPADHTQPVAGGADALDRDGAAEAPWDPVEDEASLQHEESRYEARRDD
ncbi:MAG TPA: hypothetical protein VF163_19560 [Micromonosporaceae bacterium]